MFWTSLLLGLTVAGAWGIRIQVNEGEPVVLETPNYPNPPPANLRLTWDLRTHLKRLILLTCEDIRLPVNDKCDYMYIFDGKLITEFCGENDKVTKKSDANQMTVRVTGGKVGEGGVRCTAESIEKVTYDKFFQFVSEEIDSDEHGQSGGDVPVSCPCGWTNKGRIVNGKEAKVNEYPLIVGITNRDFDFFFCGGTIVTNYHVLTAAHCTYKRTAESMAIIAGEHDVESKKETDATVKVNVKEIIQHEDYVHKIFSNDISLLVLEKKLEYNQFIGPACLPSGNNNLVNEYIKVLGWGRTQHKGSTSDVLRKVNLRVLPLEACEERFPNFAVAVKEKKQLCTFGHNKDSCQGDSGGPVIWLDPMTNRYTIVALVSFGKVCASVDPAVNTDVSFYMPWITKNIRKSNPEGQICTKRNN